LKRKFRLIRDGSSRNQRWGLPLSAIKGGLRGGCRERRETRGTKEGWD